MKEDFVKCYTVVEMRFQSGAPSTTLRVVPLPRVAQGRLCGTAY